jgi:hypothetical protein
MAKEDLSNRSSKDKYGTEVLWALLSIFLPLGWGEVMSGYQLWRVITGLVLWLIPLGFVLHVFWRWSGDKRYLRLIRVLSIISATGAFLIVSGYFIHSAAQPSFVYWWPGLVMSDGLARVYALKHEGPLSLNNLDITVVEEGFGNMASFHESENDPHSGGFVTWYQYRPIHLGSERLDILINSREFDGSETLLVNQIQPYTFPAYYVKLVDRRRQSIVMECISDARFQTTDRRIANLKHCGPLDSK